MIETPISRRELWRQRLARMRKTMRTALPFATGVFAALVALLLYHLFFPGPPQLTSSDVNRSFARLLASAPPPPAFSAIAYRRIQPSVVLIQIHAPDTFGQTEEGLGSGVVIDDSGDILTSLHVVANATDIQVSFADGTQSVAEVVGRQPQNDIAVLRAKEPPAQIVPAILGNPRAMHVGDQVFVVGNPFGLYMS